LLCFRQLRCGWGLSGLPVPAVLLVAGLALAAAGCHAGAEPASVTIRVTDPAGRAVRLEAPARRIVSTIPAATEWIVAMGAGDRLVARTEYDRQPELAGLPSVGGGLDPSVEWLASLGPDLVIAWPDMGPRALVPRLESLGIPVYTARAESIEEGLAVAADLGRLLGREPAADSAIAAVLQGLDAVADGVRDRDRPAVLYLVGLDPLTAAGAGTFIDELIRVAGGRNALDGVRSHWPALALEDVVRRDPDVVFLGIVGMDAHLENRPGWRSVSAVREGRVHGMDPDLANRWGPRLHQAAALLAQHLHPAVRP
jgi:iron complex transport system substrate-binding protein